MGLCRDARFRTLRSRGSGRHAPKMNARVWHPWLRIECLIRLMAGYARSRYGRLGTLVAAVLWLRSLISSARPSSFNSSPKFRNGQQ